MDAPSSVELFVSVRTMEGPVSFYVFYGMIRDEDQVVTTVPAAKF